MIREFSGRFVAYAFWAAAYLSFFVVFVVFVGRYFQVTVCGRRAHTDIFDLWALARLRYRGRFLVFI